MTIWKRLFGVFKVLMRHQTFLARINLLEASTFYLIVFAWYPVRQIERHPMTIGFVFEIQKLGISLNMVVYLLHNWFMYSHYSSRSKK